MFHGVEVERCVLLCVRLQEDVRSRYLLTYQSTSTKDDSQFRAIRIEVNRKGAEVNAMSGYYP